MAQHLSASQAIKDSVIIHQHEQQQQHERCESGDVKNRQQKPVAFWKQMLLTAALFGTESTTAFEQVYTMLCLQYLGVPVALMSLNGLIAGITGLSLIPLVGFLVDRGSNPKERKMLSLVFGLFVLLGGLIMLIAACAIKISQTPLEQYPKYTINTTELFQSQWSSDHVSLSTSSMSSNSSDSVTTEISRNETTSMENLDPVISTTPGTITSHGENYLPLSGLLGILGFAVTDIGFDLGTPFARAFVLEHTPTTEHSKVLVTGTLLASFAGTIMSAIGMFDMPGILEDTFHVDGTSSTFIMFTCILIVVDTCCYGCTIFTGKSIGKEMEKTKPIIQNGNSSSSKEENKGPLMHGNHLKKNSSKPVFNDIVAKLSTNKMSEDVNDETPLLFKPEVELTAAHQSYTFNLSSGAPAEAESAKNQLRLLSSRSHSVPFGDFNDRKLKELNSTHKVSSRKSKSSFCNKRLALLIPACCFSMSAMISFIMFIPNTLTIGIYGGDPLALPGTEESMKYQKGLRAAASGSLIFYISYFVTCAFNNKIFEVIGERVHFMVCHALLLVSILAFILTEREEVYYLAMATFGPYRTCVFTLPFVLANKYTQDEGEDNDAMDQPKKSQIGRVMALIGFILPCNYTIVAGIMGPFIAATNVWTPMIWSCSTISVAMIIFSSLFFV